MASSRFYVGNLFETVTEHELKSLFERFGAISKIELKNKRDVDGNVSGTFAFVTIDGLEEGAPATVIKQCNHLKWKKQILRVQVHSHLLFKFEQTLFAFINFHISNHFSWHKKVLWTG